MCRRGTACPQGPRRVWIHVENFPMLSPQSPMRRSPIVRIFSTFRSSAESGATFDLTRPACPRHEAISSRPKAWGRGRNLRDTFCQPGHSKRANGRSGNSPIAEERDLHGTIAHPIDPPQRDPGHVDVHVCGGGRNQDKQIPGEHFVQRRDSHGFHGPIGTKSPRKSRAVGRRSKGPAGHSHGPTWMRSRTSRIRTRSCGTWILSWEVVPRSDLGSAACRRQIRWRRPPSGSIPPPRTIRMCR